MIAPDELQGTFLEYVGRQQNNPQVKEKTVMLLDTRRDCTTPAPWMWDTLAKMVISGLSVVLSIRTLQVWVVENTVTDVEVSATLQMR